MTDRERCSRCNRPLTNEISIQRGLGYVCYRKIKRQEAWEALLGGSFLHHNHLRYTSSYRKEKKEHDDRIGNSQSILLWSNQSSEYNQGR